MRLSRNAIKPVLAVAPVLILPCVAHAGQPFSPGSIFLDAALPIQILIAGLLLSILAAIGICLKKLAQGPRISGGSAFLKGLRLGGPLAGLVGAAFNGLNIAVALANVKEMPPISVMAPGFAEIAFLILLGLLAGSVAVITNWAVEARLDRTVLGE